MRLFQKNSFSKYMNAFLIYSLSALYAFICRIPLNDSSRNLPVSPIFFCVCKATSRVLCESHRTGMKIRVINKKVIKDRDQSV